MSAIIRRRGTRAVCAATAVLALAGACTSPATEEPAAPAPAASTAAGRIISDTSLTVGQAVAAPAGKPVLRVTGRITTTNRGAALVLDRPTVERLGVRQVELYEPWVKQTMQFRAVRLEDLVAVAGPKPDATRLHITALDDYAVDLSLADVRAGGIMLATRLGDGSDIPIDQGGPTRVVFLNGVAAGVNPDQWVWSIKSIDVG